MENGVKRKSHLDFLRIIACFFVIINHTGYVLLEEINGTAGGFFSAGYYFLARTAVPIFFMISGATLLQKQEALKAYYQKRVLRVVYVLLIFSMLYYVVIRCLKNGEVFSLNSYFYTIYTNNMTGAFWYLNTYLGVLIMVPLIRKLVIKLENWHIVLLLVLYGVFQGGLPLIQYYKGFEVSFHLYEPLFSNYIICMILGYYIEWRMNDSQFQTKYALAAVLMIICGIGISVGGTNYERIRTNEITFFWENRVFLNIMVPAWCLFYLAKWYFAKHEINPCIKTVFIKIGSCTFGIYLFSDMVIGSTSNVFVNISHQLPLMPSLILWESVVFFICFSVVVLLRRIKIIKLIL